MGTVRMRLSQRELMLIHHFLNGSYWIMRWTGKCSFHKEYFKDIKRLRKKVGKNLNIRKLSEEYKKEEDRKIAPYCQYP